MPAAPMTAFARRPIPLREPPTAMPAALVSQPQPFLSAPHPPPALRMSVPPTHTGPRIHSGEVYETKPFSTLLLSNKSGYVLSKRTLIPHAVGAEAATRRKIVPVSATDSGVWSSIDAGATWTNALPASGGCFSTVVRGDQPADIVFATCSQVASATVRVAEPRLVREMEAVWAAPSIHLTTSQQG